MNKLDTLDIMTIIATLGMVVWNVTDYFGGMIMHLLQFWYLIIPVFIIYLISLVRTLIKVSKNGISQNKISFIAHILFLLFFMSLKVIDSDLLKSKRVITATMKDDLAHYTLVFREDGSCENNIIGFLGFKKKYNGQYLAIGDTLIFKTKPYDNDFIPDTLLIDKNQGAIFLYRNKTGDFSTEKEWLNHFEIRN